MEQATAEKEGREALEHGKAAANGAEGGHGGGAVGNAKKPVGVLKSAQTASEGRYHADALFAACIDPPTREQAYTVDGIGHVRTGSKRLKSKCRCLARRASLCARRLLPR
jgi:hypothetical protein